MRALFLLVLIVLSPGLLGPAQAEVFRADAFGIVPSETLSEERGTWSGFVTYSDGSTETVAPDAPSILIQIMGPKSIVAGKEPGHSVAIALDPFGNAAAEGQPVSFRPAEMQFVDPAVEHGIAHYLFTPEPIAGDFRVSASLGDLQSAVADFRVTADLESVTPGLDEAERPMTPEMLFDISGRQMTDRFGNIVETGTGLSLLLTQGDGAVTLIPTAASDGRLDAQMLVRDLQGSSSVRAYLAASASPTVQLEMRTLSAAAPAPLAIWPLAETERAAVLEVGPVTTSAGHMLNDGAEVHISISPRSGESVSLEGWLLDGHFRTGLPIDPADGPFIVEVTTVLGTQLTQVELGEVPLSERLEGAE